MGKYTPRLSLRHRSGDPLPKARVRAQIAQQVMSEAVYAMANGLPTVSKVICSSAVVARPIAGLPKVVGENVWGTMRILPKPLTKEICERINAETSGCGAIRQVFSNKVT